MCGAGDHLPAPWGDGLSAIFDSFDWHGEAPLHRYLLLDVFTSTPLEGNQLAVFLDSTSFSADQMQSIARELKLSETVFLLPADAGGSARVRIFTPGAELPFAGHPVLGTAFVVGEATGADRVVLETGAGPISVALEREHGRVVFGSMQQPIPTWEPFARERELLDAVGVEASLLPVKLYRNGPEHVYVRLPSEGAVAALRPNITALTDLGIAASCFAGEGQSWKTRMFAPALGVAEDPATGSAAGPLVVHLARHEAIAFGERIQIRQGAEIERPSVLYARADGDGDRIDAVEVGGAAVIVAEGRYRISAG